MKSRRFVQDWQDSLNDASSAFVPISYNRTIPITLWSSDFHISPIADIKNILSGYKVSIIDKSLSGHCHLSNTCEKNLKVINKQNGIRLEPCANALRRQFYLAYKDDSEFQSVDAFICTHATSMCELYMPFDKPMILIASTRYEIGRHDSVSWSRWNDNLRYELFCLSQSCVVFLALLSWSCLPTTFYRRIAANPRNIIAANNKYDQVILPDYVAAKLFVVE